MIPKLRNTTLIVMLIGGFLLFLPASLLLPRRSLFEILDGLCVGAAIGVFIGYSRAAWRALKLPSHRLVSGDYLVVGIVIVCASAAAIFAGQWLWRAGDKPNWIIDSLILAYTRIGIAFGLILILATNFSEHGILIVGAYRRTALLVAVSIFIAGVLVGIGLG
jgi:hypothetical protein